MQANPYLLFNGQCESAFKFYEQLLDGKITFMQTWGDSPGCENMPDEAKRGIMHATLNLDGSIVMGADSPPGTYEEPKGIHVTLSFDDPAKGEQVFNALVEGGKVTMPFQATFFSPGFGMCVDRFGIPWMVHCSQQAPA